jgi:hypothetical protein
MASVSIGLTKNQCSVHGAVLPTIGALAPDTSIDLEVRVNVSANAMARRNMITGLEKLVAYLQSGVGGDPNFPADIPHI